MLHFYAHGVGTVTLSRGLAVSLFHHNVESLPFTGWALSVARQKGHLQVLCILLRCFPDYRFILDGTLHHNFPTVESLRKQKRNLMGL